MVSYCDCFAAGTFCSELCCCPQCVNKPESRNPLAFTSKAGVGCSFVTDVKVVRIPLVGGMVAKENKSTLPSAGLFIIRYHSFYCDVCLGYNSSNSL
ncbi:hypothetical protein Cni_G26052 [Canna indica]|uniref:CRC domain-containing protein n=1 Tax=Canna indica TaxID=4628 RepID=A0AAQ3QPX6_9LILI|nr:hypothetical protein Cni_G26052 [Canna indica]